MVIVAALLVPGVLTALLLSVADAFEGSFRRIGPFLLLLVVRLVFMFLSVWRLRLYTKALHAQNISQGALFGAVVFVSNMVMTFISLSLASLFIGTSQSAAMAMSEQGRLFDMLTAASPGEVAYLSIILIIVTPVA